MLTLVILFVVWSSMLLGYAMFTGDNAMLERTYGGIKALVMTVVAYYCGKRTG